MQDERELAIELRDELVTPFFVGVDERFGVRRRPVAVARPFQLLAELQVVVDLAVEGDPHRPVLVRHRLVAGDQVHDRQPAMRECDRSIRRQVHAFAIRAPVPQRAGERGDGLD